MEYTSTPSLSPTYNHFEFSNYKNMETQNISHPPYLKLSKPSKQHAILCFIVLKIYHLKKV